MIPVRAEAISKEQVAKWLAEWEELKTSIHAAHAARDLSAGQHMQKGISLFQAMILSCSEGSASQFEVDQEYEVLPINGQERFSFIKQKPSQYASYRQLDELFTETQKKLARLRLKKAKQS